MSLNKRKKALECIAAGANDIADITTSTDLESFFHDLTEAAISLVETDDQEQYAHLTEQLMLEFDDEFRGFRTSIYHALPVSSSMGYVLENGVVCVSNLEALKVVESELTNFKFNLMQSWCKFISANMNLLY